MKTKIIVCIIATLLCTTVIPILGMAEESKLNDKENIIIANSNNGDYLDQYQNETDGSALSCENFFWAQMFKPKLGILTRVELLIKGSSSEYGVLVSIKEDPRYGNKTWVIKSSDEIPKNAYTWVEFDFKDIKIKKGTEYFLHIETPGVVQAQPYLIAINHDPDSYPGYVLYKYITWPGWMEWDPPFDFCFRTYGYENNPPIVPTITGETNGAMDTPYDYTIQTTDPEQNNVKYYIDWGDNTTTTTSLNYSGVAIIVSHMWNPKGTYTVKVKAIDEYSAESDWATLTVTMPYSYNPIQQFLERLFQRFPTAFPLLRQHMGY